MLLIEEFKNWSEANNQNLETLLTPQLQIDAFKLITKQNIQTVAKLIFEVFQMTKKGDLFLDSINCFIEKKQYKDVSRKEMN